MKNFPFRIYYNFIEATEKAECGIDDLLHFSVHTLMSTCTPIYFEDERKYDADSDQANQHSYLRIPNGELSKFKKIIKTKKNSDGEKILYISSENNLIYIELATSEDGKAFRVMNKGDFSFSNFPIKRINGLFQLWRADLKSLIFDISNSSYGVWQNKGMLCNTQFTKERASLIKSFFVPEYFTKQFDMTYIGIKLGNEHSADIKTPSDFFIFGDELQDLVNGKLREITSGEQYQELEQEQVKINFDKYADTIKLLTLAIPELQSKEGNITANRLKNFLDGVKAKYLRESGKDLPLQVPDVKTLQKYLDN